MRASAWGLLLLLLLVGCAPDAQPPPAFQPGPPLLPDGGPLPVDEDGVVMLATPNPAGASFRLGTDDPGTLSPQFFVLSGARATRLTEPGREVWTTTGQRITYADGSPDGRTARLTMRPGGGLQRYTWNSGAKDVGYLATPRDLRHFEATAYVRVRGNLGRHITLSWLLRGGPHSGRRPDLASCTGLEVPWGDQSAKAFREYRHPLYDYIPLTPAFDFAFEEGRWLGTKVLSWVVDGGTVNRLYLDTDPFDAQGRPRNAFRLYLEWQDRDGDDTGRYDVAATWAGYQTSLRVDGWRNVDFTLLSAREVFPPQGPAAARPPGGRGSAGARPTLWDDGAVRMSVHP